MSGPEDRRPGLHLTSRGSRTRERGNDPAPTFSEIREAFSRALLDVSDDRARAEIRQMLVDTLDACEQGPNEARLTAALSAFDGE